MAQNYDFQSSGWTAAAPATGAEQMFGLDAGGNLAAIPASELWTPNASNLNPYRLPRLRRALSRVRNGRGSAAINILGHSALMGQGAGTADSVGDLTAGAAPYAVPAAVKAGLVAKGVPARKGSFFGGALSLKTGASRVIADIAAYDPRLTFPSGTWQGNGGGTPSRGSAGGYMLQSTAVGKMTFAPTESWDRATLYYATFSGGGSFTADTGGASLGTVATMASSTGLGSTTISAAADAVQSLNLNPTSTSQVYIIGVETYRSTVNEVRVRQLATSGITSSVLVDSAFPYSTTPFMTALGGDCTFIECFRNDQSTGPIAPATTQANLSAIAATCKAFGDVVFFIDHQPATAAFTLNEAAYEAAVRAAAATVNAPVLSIPSRIGGATDATNLGYFSSDNVHYNADGWQDIGGWVASIVAAL